jgi:succinate dehydrogenase / fumarate reductase, membrane anchor subunit
MKNKFRSDLSIAKNLGSAASGSRHWWHQRFTAIILVISTIWLFVFSWELSGLERGGVIEVIKNPYNVIMLSIFTLTGFYHAALGMQVVIEDYVTCRAYRLVMLLIVQIFSIVTAIAFLVAVLYVMTLWWNL